MDFLVHSYRAQASPCRLGRAMWCMLTRPALMLLWTYRPAGPSSTLCCTSWRIPTTCRCWEGWGAEYLELRQHCSAGLWECKPHLPHLPLLPPLPFTFPLVDMPRPAVLHQQRKRSQLHLQPPGQPTQRDVQSGGHLLHCGGRGQRRRLDGLAGPLRSYRHCLDCSSLEELRTPPNYFMLHNYLVLLCTLQCCYYPILRLFGGCYWQHNLAALLQCWAG